MEAQIIQKSEKTTDATPETTWLRPIVHTIKTLARIGEHIKFHQSYPEPDDISIGEWQEVRADLTRQLVEMLAEVGVKLQIPAEAA